MRYKKIQMFLLPVLVISLIIITTLNIITFREIKKGLYIFNTLNIINGSVQRLTKLELSNKPNDTIIFEINELFNQINMEYKQIYHIFNTWNVLTNEIYDSRINGNKERIALISEEFYELCFQETELKNENLKKYYNLHIIEILVNSIIIVALILIFVQQLFLSRKGIKFNRAFIDKLTELPDRISCDQIIAKYNNGKLISNLVCICFDINNLKGINDAYGHSAGDKIIFEFGNILKEISQEYGFIGRNGGDEFLAFFENFNLEKLDKYLETLKLRVNEYNRDSGIIKIDFAYGAVSSNSYKVNTVFDMLNIADRLMYEQKQKNKI